MYGILLSIIIVLFAIFIGILNFSADDSILYRKGVELAFSDSFKNGCFCLRNKLDSSLLKFGDECLNNKPETDDECTSEMIVVNNKVYKDLVLGGDVGFGEAFVKEYWIYDTDKYDLGDILTEFILGVTSGEATMIDFVLKYLIIEKWKQWYERKYSIEKSMVEDQSSIEAHYDLGDDIYESFLDDTMMYTCAIWDNINKNNLTKAQINKINILIDKMGITEDDKVLDLGTGWGYTPYHIHTSTNATAVGITMSKNQHTNNVKKFKDIINNKKNKNTLGYKYMDYRNYNELQKYKFNKIISIGMMEHVGIKNLDKFWNVASKILDSSQDNVIGLHYFTMGDITPSKLPVDKNKACQQQTFIFKYIFPGACLLYPDWINEYALKYDFNLLHQEYYGLHYAKTLQVWREEWVKNGMDVIKNNAKYDKSLFKLYEFYLALSEAMFRTGHVTLIHQIYVKQNVFDKTKYKGKMRKSKYIDIEYIFDNFKIPHSQ